MLNARRPPPPAPGPGSRGAAPRILLLGGVLGPVLFAGVVVALAALQPGYSHVANFISELGATGAERAAVMNFAAFVPSGLLLAGFGASLALVLPRTAASVVGSALVVIFGTGIALSGIASCDPDCPQSGGSVENLVHNTLAPVSFLALIAAAGLFGYYFRRCRGRRVLSLYSFLTCMLGLIFMAGLVSSLDERDLTGIWQRMLLAALFLWCATVAVALYVPTGSKRPGRALAPPKPTLPPGLDEHES